MSGLWTQVQHPPGRLRLRTIRAARASGTGVPGKDDLDAIWLVDGRLALTFLPLRTGHEPSLPIDLEMSGIKALVGFGLPTVV